MGKNLHKYYYKDYFGDIDFSFLRSGNSTLKDRAVRAIKRKNQELCSSVLEPLPQLPGTDTFEKPLEVVYPGLVTGIGINHEATIEGEFKLGVHFDWTYGMPVIYGSSVKGVLSSYFKEFYELKEGKPERDAAFDDIFNGAHKSIYERDIFFDAVILRGDRKGRILCPDSITPHGGENHDNPLKNPVPITFMKIAAGSTLEFRFRLVDTVINGKTFSKEDKLALFQKILTTVGAGAKTNVGYGQLKIGRR